MNYVFELNNLFFGYLKLIAIPSNFFSDIIEILNIVSSKLDHFRHLFNSNAVQCEVVYVTYYYARLR